jgi:flagellar biosynthesis activator protein FlaF
MSLLNPHDAAGTYARTATETASPRELEATLLLRAAGKLQAVREAWSDKPPGLSEALLYNRRLWIVLMDAVMRDDNKLPVAIRQNILSLGMFVMAETFSLMTKPKLEYLANIIRINRRIAAGLRGKPPLSHRFFGRGQFNWDGRYYSSAARATRDRSRGAILETGDRCRTLGVSVAAGGTCRLRAIAGNHRPWRMHGD